MSQASPQQIPVIVLAGFLGSGKTTLLNHLLHSSGGSRLGAIVNDFGAIEIDAMAVAGALGDSTVSLGNGCLCCAVDVSELDGYLDRLTRPSARIDVVVIEASGLAEPQELVRMVLASENPRVVYGGLVEVVDAAEFDATRARHPEIDRHLALADLVVLNKTDRVADGGRVHGTVAGLAGRAAVVPASYGRVDPEFLFDCRPTQERIGQLSFFDDLHAHGENPGGHAGHLHSAYESVDFTSDVPLAPRPLMDFLDSRPEGLYRIKGHVDFGVADPCNAYGVHAVGRFLRFYPRPWEPGEDRRTQLVLIGSGVDAAALRAGLEGCRDAALAADPRSGADAAHADAPPAGEHGMWGVLRYVRDREPERGGPDVSGEGPGAEPDPDEEPAADRGLHEEAEPAVRHGAS
ncbi:CobW family GTP-binding protein [Streptomyces minutiscleroticus]|uniref:Cobalamin biosynthesis protein CobW n=1 Tax=Streptomyces minutiscleroticus TaxID=68238 RepID=A0A918NIU5_9ACTN|nr:GTP-binding protein [Streptomyces minutiscleroticus]GGX70763.1 cobalamin biosynthesis protein CobW [Streptomyces minutiscleroticus]